MMRGDHAEARAIVRLTSGVLTALAMDADASPK
jgi:hypothetical protein